MFSKFSVYNEIFFPIFPKEKGEVLVSKIKTILKELFCYLPFIWVLARYEKKASFQGHKFGIAWEYLNPLIQLATWGFVFGVLRNRSAVLVGENLIPFIPWMLVGMTAWGFMNGAAKRGGASVRRKNKSFSKLKYPLSLLPAITMAQRLSTYLVLLLLTLIVLFISGFTPTLQWFGFIYYFFSMLIFVYFLALLLSTIIARFRDFQNITKPIWRMLFFFSGPIWRVQEMMPGWFGRLMDLTPFSYIITGLRQTFFGVGFFGNNWLIRTAAFWLVVLLLAIAGTHSHLKYRNRLIEEV